MSNKTWASDNAGVLINGHQGWYAYGQMIDLAIESGYPISTEDAVALERYRRGELSIMANEDIDTAVQVMDHGGLLDRAETWMNEHVAPERYRFGWFEGEFFLAHEQWWNQDDPETEGWTRANDGILVPIDIHGQPL